MKTIPKTICLWLILAFSFINIEKAFSHASQEGKNKDTTGSITANGDGNSHYVRGMTSGRAQALVGVAAGLVSVIAGWRARVRSSAGTGNRTGALVALILGVTGIILSIVHLSTTMGAVFGSGSGKAGSIFAILLCMTGIILGWLSVRSLNKS